LILTAALVIGALLTSRAEAGIALSPPKGPVAESAQAEESLAVATPGAVLNAGTDNTDVLSGEDLTCSDFASQAEAQAAFDAAGTGDPHGLDLDLDGVACETPFMTPPGEGGGVPAVASPVPLDGRAVNCVDFAFQEDAQVVYDRIPGDPYNLDPSGDGYACASLPSRGS
jgi:hypothetical protein